MCVCVVVSIGVRAWEFKCIRLYVCLCLHFVAQGEYLIFFPFSYSSLCLCVWARECCQEF